MKTFETPKVEIIRFENADIITNSDNNSNYWEDPDTKDNQGGNQG